MKLLPDECHRTSLIRSQPCSGNGLMPLGNKPLPDPVWTFSFSLLVFIHKNQIVCGILTVSHCHVLKNVLMSWLIITEAVVNKIQSPWWWVICEGILEWMDFVFESLYLFVSLSLSLSSLSLTLSLSLLLLPLSHFINWPSLSDCVSRTVDWLISVCAYIDSLESFRSWSSQL